MTARRGAAAGILTLFLGLYGLTFHGYVDVEDAEVCYQSVSALLDRGTLALGDTETARQAIDRDFCVVRGPDGRYYPVYPLLQLLLQVPGTVAGRWLSALATERPDEVARLGFAGTNVLASALLAVIVFALGRRLGQTPRIAALAALAGGAGTVLWWYAQSTFADPLLAVLTSASVLCLLSAGPRPGARAAVGWLLAAGVLHGLACQVRPAALILLLPGAWFARGAGGARALLAFLLPAAAVIAGVAWLDAEVFGRSLAGGYAEYASAHPPVWTHSYTLGLHGLLLSDGRGLFVTSPVLLLAVLAWPGQWREAPRPALLIAAYTVVPALVFAAFDGWHGGWCHGPRYLLPAVPLLAALAGCWLQRPSVPRRALAIGVIAVSLALQALAVAVPHRIWMHAATTADAHLDQFVHYARYAPPRAQWRILVHKLRGEPGPYTRRLLFDLDDDRPLPVTERPTPAIDRYSAGFSHFAWVRVFSKGHRVTAVTAAASCLLAMGLGLAWLLRATRAAAGDAKAAGAANQVSNFVT